MKRALCLILVAVVLAALSCESNTPSPPNALAIVRAAEENLRAVSSFHIAIIVEEDGRETSVRADIVPPDMGRFVISGLAERTIRIEIETLQVSRANYTLYPGFQAWVDMDEMSLYRFDLQSFPYELSGLREAVESFELLGEGVIDGVDAYRLTAIGTDELRQKVHLRPGVGVPEVELWISRVDLLPLRIETTTEDPEASLTYIYSDFGGEVDVSAPEQAIDFRLLDRFREGELSPEELGQVVRFLPVPGQQCIEAEIGAEVYREVIGGDSEEDFLVLTAFDSCESEIFPLTENP